MGVALGVGVGLGDGVTTLVFVYVHAAESPGFRSMSTTGGLVVSAGAPVHDSDVNVHPAIGVSLIV